MSELICNLQSGKDPVQIPAWTLDYLLTQPLRDILHSAAFRKEHDIVPVDAETCALPRLDIKRILLRRWIISEYPTHPIILSFYLSKSGSVIPFIMVDAEYSAMLPAPPCTKHCIIEGQWPHQVSEETDAIRAICTKCVFDKESGKRVHLRPHLSNVRHSHLSPTMVGLRQKLEDLLCALRRGIAQPFSVTSIHSRLT